MAFHSLRIEDLLVLTRIAHHGSAAAAARALGVTTSQITKTLQKLEAAVGEPLVIRSANGAKPNASGRALIAEITPLIERLDQAHRPRHAPRLDIASPSYLSSTMLVAAHKAAPSMHCRMIEAAPSALRAQITSGLFTLAVTPLETRANEWSCDRIGVLRSGLFARPSLAKKLGKRAIDEKLAAELVYVRPIYRSESGFTYGDDRCPLGTTARRFGDEVHSVSSAFAVAEVTDQVVFGPVTSALGRDLVEVRVKGWAVDEPLFVLAHAQSTPAKILRDFVSVLATLVSNS